MIPNLESYNQFREDLYEDEDLQQRFLAGESFIDLAKESDYDFTFVNSKIAYLARGPLNEFEESLINQVSDWENGVTSVNPNLWHGYWLGHDSSNKLNILNGIVQNGPEVSCDSLEQFDEFRVEINEDEELQKQFIDGVSLVEIGKNRHSHFSINDSKVAYLYSYSNGHIKFNGGPEDMMEDDDWGLTEFEHSFYQKIEADSDNSHEIWQKYWLGDNNEYDLASLEKAFLEF